jgi:hypothetical protein
MEGQICQNRCKSSCCTGGAMLLAFFFFATIYMLSDPKRCCNLSGPCVMIKAFTAIFFLLRSSFFACWWWDICSFSLGVRYHYHLLADAGCFQPWLVAVWEQISIPVFGFLVRDVRETDEVLSSILFLSRNSPGFMIDYYHCLCFWIITVSGLHHV